MRKKYGWKIDILNYNPKTRIDIKSNQIHPNLDNTLWKSPITIDFYGRKLKYYIKETHVEPQLPRYFPIWSEFDFAICRGIWCKNAWSNPLENEVANSGQELGS